MAYLEGENRYQSTFIPRSLDEQIDDDNPVRVIDAYVDSVDLVELGFNHYLGTKAGQKPYRRQDILKIILYCYMNKIRSSRMIEQETKRNIELMWLTSGLSPDHGTIAGFIKDNKSAIKALFKDYVLMLKGLALIEGKLIAIDGTKIRASNAKNKHFNHNKIKIKLEYYENRIKEYLDEIEKTDEDISPKVKEKFEKYTERINRLKEIQTELKDEKKKQICLTDPDAKSMRNNGCFEPCYNVQTAVDEKNKIIIAYDVVNDGNDQAQLKNMVDRAKEVMNECEDNEEARTFILDTGYYNRQQIVEVTDDKTEILIKKRAKASDKIGDYDKVKFDYNSETNSFICPDGYEVIYKHREKSHDHPVYKYKCIGFDACKNREKCTKSKTGREITVSTFDNELKDIEKNTLEKNHIYKKRGCIVEHPFGTIKRHFGYDHFLRRGFDSVQSEMGLILLAYNLKRAIKVLGVKEMMSLLRA